ncbi:hypothetical protein [Marmoricola sp. RAF53]|uniref:hypothetical protein n=1 Tax=Marmoricola sp. RAF53 TaxID=3233059 RepID=UPI003F993A4E
MTALLRATASLTLDESTGTARLEVLRTFDLLRRELSERLCEADGVFAGYDVIEFAGPKAPGCDDIFRVRATLLHDSGKLHRVEYVAEVEATGEAGRAEVFVRGVGVTLTPGRAARGS